MTSSARVPGLIEPIQLSVRVRRSIDAAFDLFTRDIGSWWPLDRFSFDTSRSMEVHIEPFVGGRFVERYSDGEEHTSGQVLKWDPPLEVAYTWAHNDWVAPTEVSGPPTSSGDLFDPVHAVARSTPARVDLRVVVCRAAADRVRGASSVRFG